MAVSADAAVSVITDIATTPTFLASGTGSHVLDSITDATGTLGDLTFSTVTTANDSNITYGVNGAAPGTGNAALSDNQVDTGKLSVGGGTVFNVTPASASQKLFIIFNASSSSGFYQGPGLVTAVDSDGNALGTVTVNDSTDGENGVNDVVTVGDAFTDSDLARVGAGTLFNRLILGVTIDVADFGVSNLSDIAGFTIAGEVHTNATVDNFDIQTVGLAVPEPASMGLVLAALLSVFSRRRR